LGPEALPERDGIGQPMRVAGGSWFAPQRLAQLDRTIGSAAAWGLNKVTVEVLWERVEKSKSGPCPPHVNFVKRKRGFLILRLALAG
jgi:hypothetical protein